MRPLSLTGEGSSMSLLPLIRNFPASSLAVLISLGLTAGLLVWDIEFFELIVDALEAVEHLQFDEVILIVFILLAGGVFDLLRLKRRHTLKLMKERERLRTLQATMRTVQDIVGNFLNNLMLYQLEIEESGALDRAKLDEMERLIHATSQKLHKLSGLKVAAEKEFAKDLHMIDLDAQ